MIFNRNERRGFAQAAIELARARCVILARDWLGWKQLPWNGYSPLTCFSTFSLILGAEKEQKKLLRIGKRTLIQEFQFAHARLISILAERNQLKLCVTVLSCIEKKTASKICSSFNFRCLMFSFWKQNFYRYILSLNPQQTFLLVRSILIIQNSHFISFHTQLALINKTATIH